ncbi:threonine/serine dehydratase [Rhodobacteraceae bacterium CCMM004]|nr:threonine/serine dehydratase [Rhodobacteraceae bacterium CCMM004]
MITRDDIAAAHDLIRGRVRETPVLRLEPGALGLDMPLTLKLEHMQRTGSFKIRGAFYAMLSRGLPDAGAVAASGGNHGAAVACAASDLGAPSVIYVPRAIAKPEKIARMEGFGGEVRLTDGTVADCMAAYAAHAEETGALSVHPYDTAPTLTGQGTLGREIEAQAPEIDTLMVSVGGGGLIGGISAWFGRRIKVVGCETRGTATLARTLAEGPGFAMEVSGVAASSLGGPNIGDLPWQILQQNGVGAVTVSDDDVHEAQHRLWSAARIVCEPGAAVAVAALTSGAYVPERGERVGILVCGGNAEPGWFLD